jgi:hypothetical protein
MLEHAYRRSGRTVYKEWRTRCILDGAAGEPEDRTGGTGCILENTCKSLWERIGREGWDACLRVHANHCGRG